MTPTELSRIGNDVHERFWNAFKMHLLDMGWNGRFSAIEAQGCWAFRLGASNPYLSVRRDYTPRLRGPDGAGEVAVKLILEGDAAPHHYALLTREWEAIDAACGPWVHWIPPRRVQRNHAQVFVRRPGVAFDPSGWSADLEWLASKLISMHEYFRGWVDRRMTNC